MQRYRAQMLQIAPGSPIEPDTTNVQQALAALQDKALVWRAARGVYALEDSFLGDLMREAGMIAASADAQGDGAAEPPPRSVDRGSAQEPR